MATKELKVEVLVTVKVPLVEILVPTVVLTPDAWEMIKTVAKVTAKAYENSRIRNGKPLSLG